jgi:hypothetical protein
MTTRRRCVVPDCHTFTDRGLLCSRHYDASREGRLTVDPGVCRVCGGPTPAPSYTYCDAHHRALRGRQRAAVVPRELVDWFTHRADCTAADGKSLALYVQPDGVIPGLACRACHRDVALRSGAQAELARRELVAVGAIVDAPPKRAAAPVGRYMVACACDCGEMVSVPSPKPGRYYVEGHR